MAFSLWNNCCWHLVSACYKMQFSSNIHEHGAQMPYVENNLLAQIPSFTIKWDFFYLWLFSLYPSTDLIVHLLFLLVSLVSVQNAWQSFVAYDACFRLCLNAWARNCMEAPEFLRDECIVLRSAFGYATAYTWINVPSDLELLCHILLSSTQLMSSFLWTEYRVFCFIPNTVVKLMGNKCMIRMEVVP